MGDDVRAVAFPVAWSRRWLSPSRSGRWSRPPPPLPPRAGRGPPAPKPEEIEVKAEGGLLTISGEHEESTEKKEAEYLHRERRYGAFHRTLALPKGTDPKGIEATVRDGVLEVLIPLQEEVAAEAVTITPTAKD